jgi:HTH-type transcriptional regulator/antitoxin HigA
MNEMNKENDEIESLLNSFLVSSKKNLRAMFENELREREMSQNKALDLLDMEIRGLNGILDGTAVLVDPASLVNLSKFLRIEYGEFSMLFLEEINKNRPKDTDINKREFILENFDLQALKKIGIIKNITDYAEIEKSINSHFGYDDIYEYKKHGNPTLYSATKSHKDNLTIDYWRKFGMEYFEQLKNKNEYSRNALIEFFPKIRWYSMNVEMGLASVIKELYKIGVSVVYQEKHTHINVRGATMLVNDKPSIILTDQRGFYPTLWFALVHELHHVLFDWEMLQENEVHVSTDKLDLYTHTNIEEKANKFARDFLFNDEKMQTVLPCINDQFYVREFAQMNHVHESIIYANHAFDQDAKGDKRAYGRLTKLGFTADKCIQNLPKNPILGFAKESAKNNKELYFK